MEINFAARRKNATSLASCFDSAADIASAVSEIFRVRLEDFQKSEEWNARPATLFGCGLNALAVPLILFWATHSSDEYLRGAHTSAVFVLLFYLLLAPHNSLPGLHARPLPPTPPALKFVPGPPPPPPAESIETTE